MTERKGPGRPRGKRYVRQKSLKLREEDVRRLEALSLKLDRDQSSVIRLALQELAKREKIE